jgi:SNF2 family DNA or RNA helicase
MSPIKKAEATAKFRNDPDCKYFLSSHSGAYGLDMNMSDILINYDLPWSAGKQDQINSRHRRRSSEFETVYVNNLVLKNSFEERRLRVLDRKKRLGSAILDGTGADKGGKIILEGDSLRQHLTSVVQHGIME